MPFRADEDGKFKIAVLPGRGILGARFGNDTYRLGVGVDRIKGLKQEAPGLIRARPAYLTPKNYNTLVAIDPKEGEESVRADIELDPGRTLRGKLVGPDGKPLAGARMLARAGLLRDMVASAPRFVRVRGPRAGVRGPSRPALLSRGEAARRCLHHRARRERPHHRQAPALRHPDRPPRRPRRPADGRGAVDLRSPLRRG